MKTFKMMRSEYLCWLFNSRIILLPCVFIIVYTMITSDLVKCANNMGAPINLLEPFIGICNSATFLGFIPIVFLVLIADFPRIDNNMIFKIYRAGRIKWVFITVAIFTCCRRYFCISIICWHYTSNTTARILV